MADVTKQLVPVVFEGGLDTKSTKQTVVPGRFLVLENCVRVKANKVQKRFGFTALGNGLSSGVINRGNALARFKDDLLLFGRDTSSDNQDRLYSYSTANNNWLSRGAAVTATVDSLPIIRNSYIQSMPDVCVGDGITCTVWLDSRGGARYSLTDNSTSAVIVYDQSLNTSALQVKCVFINNTFVMVYRTATALLARTISSNAPSVLSSEVISIGSGVDDAPFDLVKATDNYALYVLSSGGNVEYGYILSNGSVGDVLDGLPAPVAAAEDATEGVTIAVDSSTQRLYIGAVSTSGELVLICDTYNFLGQVTQTVETIAGMRNVTIAALPNSQATIFYEVGATNTYDHYVRSCNFTWTGSGSVTIQAPQEFLRSVGLFSKAFIVEENIYVGTTFETQLQPTYFIVRSDKLIVSRILGGLGDGLTTSPAGVLQSGLCSAAQISDTDHYVMAGVRLKLEAAEDNTVLSTAVGLNRIAVSVGTTTYSTDTIGENMLIAGGTLLNYDGVSVTEHGFHVFPEVVTSNVSSGSGTFSGAGTLGYAVTYEWIDARGQIHRSAPSVTEVVTLAAGTDEVELVIPKLRLTQKQTNRAPVKITVYRTTVDGATILYKLREISNDNTVEAGVVKTDDQVTYTDTNADGVGLAAREILYTVGGTLENIAPNSSKILARHKNRIFLGALEDGTAVQYSREWVFGEGVNFSDGLLLRVDALGGDVTAIGSLDDKLIIFKKDRVFAVSGDGPVDTGENNNFSLPILVSGDVGCSDQDSLLITPDGLMFKSDKGIYVLTTGLVLNYVGAPVEDFNALSVSGAVLMEDYNEARFTTSDGQTLVYNYFFGQWSTFTNYESTSSIVALNSFLHLKADGTVNQEITDSYNDNGSRIKMAMETSWLAFAGIQGFQRVYWIHGLGSFMSHHFAEIKLAYDYEEVYNETAYFDTRVGVGTGVYGDTGPFGEGGFGGENADVSTEWAWRMKPRRARCEAVKVRIEDIDTIGTNPNASFEFVALSFVVGSKKNGMRQPLARTIGSSN